MKAQVFSEHVHNCFSGKKNAFEDLREELKRYMDSVVCHGKFVDVLPILKNRTQDDLYTILKEDDVLKVKYKSDVNSCEIIKLNDLGYGGVENSKIEIINDAESVVTLSFQNIN